MKNNTTYLTAFLLLASAAVYGADEKAAGAIDSKAAFARMKALVGEWQANTKMGKASLSYELIAGGTSLVERETGEHMPPMLTVYHLDGNRLMLTHYCAAGNQPRMQARSFDAKTGELQFQFLDATNLPNKNAGHMRNASFHFVDNGRFIADWEFHENGQKKTERFEYVRVR